MEFEQFKNNLNLLGLEPGATLEQLKEAFKHSLHAFHPDKYEAGSSSQKWAADRLILVKDAYEKLQVFFKENPAGEPTGGWPGTEQKTKGSQVEGDSMDWQAWESEQQGSFAEELKAYEARQKDTEVEKAKEHSKQQRKTLLGYAKACSIAILFIFFMGRGCSGAGKQIGREGEDWAWQGKYPSPEMQATPEAQREKEAIMRRWEGEDLSRKCGEILFFAMVGGWCWFVFAPRPKRVLNQWADTGNFDWSEMKSALGDAAAKTKTAAEIAARKTVEAAEKLKQKADSLRADTKASMPEEEKPGG